MLSSGGRIDHAHHDNLPKLAMEDTISFDEGVARALSLTSEKDTLIIVTADHAHPFTLGSWASLNNSILGEHLKILVAVNLGRYYCTLTSWRCTRGQVSRKNRLPVQNRVTLSWWVS